MISHVTIFQVSALSVLIPLVIGILRWKHLDTSLKIFYGLIVCGFLFDIVGHVAAINQKSNLAYVHVFLFIQTIIICSYFLKLPVLEKRYKKWIFIFFIFSILFSILLVIIYPFENSLNKWLLAFSSIIVILLSFLYFYDLLQHGLHIPLWKSSTFYVISGLLLYHVSNTGLFLTFDYFNEKVATQLWQFKSMGYIFLNLLLAFAFYIHARIQFDE